MKKLTIYHQLVSVVLFLLISLSFSNNLGAQENKKELSETSSSILKNDIGIDKQFISKTKGASKATIWADDFETDKGWTLTGEWERGVPNGLGGEHGYPDPASAYQGSRVIGTDLTGLHANNGDYEKKLADRAYIATSPVIDCSTFLNVHVTFQLWLNVEGSTYDHAYIDVFDGSNWVQIWTNSSTTIGFSSWQAQDFDLSSYADGNANFKIRYSIGATDGSWFFSGWNIDDFQVTGDVAAVCATPTNQPTSLVLTPDQTFIDGSFTAATSNPDGYLVVMSTASSLSGSPVDGVTYSAGDALGGGTVVQSGAGTSFTATGLTSGTQYYFFIFSQNFACSGGPVYQTTTPLTGDATTITQPYSPLPYSTSFESGLDSYWKAYTENAYGRILITGDNAPHTGVRHMTMDVNTNGNYATNEAHLHLDLSGETDVKLTFWFKDSGDENNTGANGDGIFFSDDGGVSFTEVHHIDATTYTDGTYYEFILDVDALATANGLTLTNQFIIKFQQRDNYTYGYDGFAFDDINVYCPNDETSIVEAPTSGQIPASDISSLITSNPVAVEVFRFNISDLGSGDGVPTKVQTFNISKNGGTADWTDNIGGAELWSNGAQILNLDLTITDTDLTFAKSSGTFDIADGTSEEITLKIWLKTQNIADNSTLIFEASQTNHGFVSDISGSMFDDDFGSATVSNTHTIRVIATQLLFTGQPSSTANSGVALATQPIVSATDANGNVDTDITSTVTLDNTGSLTMNNTSMNFVAGVADFGTPNNFMFTSGGAYVMLTATAPGLSTQTPSLEIAVDIIGCEIFSDNFNSYATSTDLNHDGADWDFLEITNSVNDWGIATVSGSDKCLTIFKGNTPFQYKNSNDAEQIAYYTTPIDATNFKDLTLEFDWQSDGDPGVDYGTIVWATKDPTVASNWSIIEPTEYSGQATFISAIKNISVCDGQQFYIGFRWINDGSGNTDPPFAVDNISIKGFPKLDYNFSYRQDNYEAITGTIVSTDGTDGVNISLPAGFDFKYDGVAVTNVRANINGWMQMGTSYVADAAPINSLTNLTYSPFLAPFWDDLTADGQTHIIYTVSGTAPTRVFQVEWRDVLWGTERQNFQVQLYESSYVIEFWYGVMNTNAGGSTSIGINNIGGCRNKMISVNPGSTPIPSYTAENRSINSATYLNSGLVYIFNPISMQTYRSWQEATVCIGQPDWSSQNTTMDQVTAAHPSSAAISSKNVLAVGQQGVNYSATDIREGRILLWNSTPTTNGVAADVVLGKSNFTDVTGGCTADRVNSINGVCFTPDGEKLVGVDFLNNRVLIWNSIPTVNGTPADVVVGQASFTSNSAGTSASSLNGPLDAIVLPDGKLLISDAGNNRVLIYNAVPTTNGVSADVVIGQTGFGSNAAGNGTTGLSGPWGLSYSPDAKLFIADRINERILVYNDVPTFNGASADQVIGQNDFSTSNTGTSPTLFDRPLGVTISPEGKMAVCEFFNHRATVYDRVPSRNGGSGDYVLGQPNFYEAYTFNDGISQQNMTTPDNRNMQYAYATRFDLNGRLLVVGRDMNRVMLYGETPTETSDLEISIVSNEVDVCILADVQYTVQVTNHGGDPASNVVVNAQLPVGFIANSYDASIGTYNQKSGYWMIPYVAVGETVTLLFEGEVQSDLSGKNVTAYANIIASKQADSDFSNNGANQIIAVRTFFAPTSTEIDDQYINKNSHTIPVIGFTVADQDGLTDIASYTCTSSNTTLIPVNYVTNLLFAGAEPDKTLDVYPSTDEYGYSDMQLIVTDIHGCYKEYEFTIAVGNIWEGDYKNHTKWDEPSNWSSGNVPSPFIEAIVPTVPIGGYFPIIDVADAKCEDFVIQPKASVTLNDTYTLRVHGDMIIESDATGTGSFVDLNSAGGSVQTDGNVTVERYLTPEAWHYLSSPLTGVANTDLTENTCGPYNGNLLDYNEAYSYDYDGDGDTDWFDGWEWPWYYTHNSNVLVPGNGYAFYTFSGQCNPVSKFTTTGANSLTSGDITYTVTNQDENYKPTGFGNHHGWNLIGNPYASGINAEEFITENCGVGKPLDGTLYLWDENGFTGFNAEGSDYAAFNTLGSTNAGTGAGSILPDKYISIGQAFFVHRTNTDIGGSTITFKNSMREQENSNFFKGAKVEVPKVKLSVKNEYNMYNQIIVALKDDATDSVDVLYDGLKMEGNEKLSLYTKIGEDGFTIQALQSLEVGQTKSVIVGLNAGYIGDYEFNVLLIEYMPQNISIWLEDTYEDKMINLRKENSYPFNVNTEGRYEDRFILHFNANTAPELVSEIDDVQVYEDEPTEMNISTSYFTDADENDQLSYDIKMANGEDLPYWINFNNNSMTLTVDATNDEVGIYQLEMTATDLVGESVSSIFNLEVVNTNDAPVLVTEIENQTAFAGIEFSYQIPQNTFLDIDADDILSLSVEKLPNWLFFDNNTGLFTGLPNNQDAGNNNITVTATDLSGAYVSETFDIEVKGTTDIDNIQKIVEFYPNPSNGKFVIKSQFANYQLTITDALGRKISQTTVSSNTQSVDLTGNTAGVYMINIVLQDGSIINESIIIK